MFILLNILLNIQLQVILLKHSYTYIIIQKNHIKVNAFMQSENFPGILYYWDKLEFVELFEKGTTTWQRENCLQFSLCLGDRKKWFRIVKPNAYGMVTRRRTKVRRGWGLARAKRQKSWEKYLEKIFFILFETISNYEVYYHLFKIYIIAFLRSGLFLRPRQTTICISFLILSL